MRWSNGWSHCRPHDVTRAYVGMVTQQVRLTKKTNPWYNTNPCHQPQWGYNNRWSWRLRRCNNMEGKVECMEHQQNPGLKQSLPEGSRLCERLFSAHWGTGWGNEPTVFNYQILLLGLSSGQKHYHWRTTLSTTSSSPDQTNRALSHYF